MVTTCPGTKDQPHPNHSFLNSKMRCRLSMNILSFCKHKNEVMKTWFTGLYYGRSHKKVNWEAFCKLISDIQRLVTAIWTGGNNVRTLYQEQLGTIPGALECGQSLGLSELRFPHLLPAFRTRTRATGSVRRLTTINCSRNVSNYYLESSFWLLAWRHTRC